MKLKHLFACALLCLTTLANAQTGPFQDGPRSGFRQLVSTLGLTDAQKADVKQLMLQQRNDIRVFAEDLRQSKEQLQGIIQAPTFDVEAANDLLSVQQDLMAQIGLVKAGYKHQIWQLLDAEQQQVWQDKRAEFAERERPEGFQQARQERLFERLDFSDEQIAAAEAILASRFEQLQPFAGSRRAFKEAEFALISAETFDQQAWLTLHGEFADDFLAAQLILLESRHGLYQFMTPQQRAKAKRAKRGGKGKGRRQL